MLVRDILPSVKDLIGRCDNSIAFQRISHAISELSKEGNFDLLTGYVDICACSDGCTVTLPRDIETPLAVNVGGYPAFFRSKWFEFHFNGPGSRCPATSFTWDDRGFVPVAMDIIQPSNLIAVADLKTDLTASLRVFGYDDSGNWIRTQNPDGTWSDGFLVPINIISDFPMGLVVPDTTRRFVRNFSTPENTELIVTGASTHQLTTGALVVLSLINAPLPGGLTNGGTYYVRKVSDQNVSLHTSQSGALLGTGIVDITSWNSSSVVSLTDQRQLVVQTQFNSSINHDQRTGMVVQFTATTFPTPLEAGVNYYTRVIDDTNFQIHATQSDAESNINPIDVSTPGTGVKVQAFQDILPITLLDFSVPHNFLQGDAVKAVNSSGALPEPLLPDVTYYVRYISSTRITLHTSIADSSTGDNPVIFLSSGSGASSIVKTVSATANVGTSSNITAIGHNLTIQSTYAGLTTASRARTSNVATIVFGSPHGLSTGTLVTVSGLGGTGYNVTTPVSITKVNTTTISYPNTGSNEGTTADTGGTVTKVPQYGDFVQFVTSGVMPAGLDQNTTYRAEPPMSTDTFTVYTTSAVPVNILNTGSGQLQLAISRVFTIGFTSQWQTNATVITNGDEIKFSATGALPSCNPTINSSTTYFARKINDNTIEIYDTSAHAIDTAARASTQRARASNVATITTSAAHGFTTGDYVDISGLEATKNGVLTTVSITSGGTLYVEAEIATITDGSGHTAKGELTVSAGVITAIRITDGGSGFTVAGALTVTGSGSSDAVVSVASVTNGVAVSNSSYNGTRIQITVTGASTFTYTSVGLNEPTTADTGGVIVRSDIKVLNPGVGDISLVFERTVTAIPFSSLLRVSTASFLEDGATIQLQTTGTLPAPLAVGTDYHLGIESGLIRIKDTLDNNITLTNIGSGIHYMTITRNFNVNVPTNFVVTDNNYDDGDQVTLETTDSLPGGLSPSTNYYLRRLDNDHVEFYDTAAHATNLSSTTGRITASDTGEGVQTIVQILSNFLVQRVERINKSETDGFINLYAWDLGRTDNLTILGRFYPDELQPLYRRIIVAQKCQWIRMRYRKSQFQIKSEDDFIPVRDQMALLMMVKGIDLLFKQFNDQATPYIDMANSMIAKKQSNDDGPEMPTIQINSDIFTDPAAESMDRFYGGYWGNTP